jgi:hypothetical protein
VNVQVSITKQSCRGSQNLRHLFPAPSSTATPFGIAPDFYQIQELPSPQPATLIAHRVMAFGTLLPDG